MKSKATLCWSLLVGLLGLSQIGPALAADWTETLMIADEPLTNVGRNAYFILEPGYQLVLGGKESGEEIELTITVLDTTLNIGAVSTRVVEERQSTAGKLIKVSRDYFALGLTTTNLYHFGEDLYGFGAGRRLTPEGAWREGTDGAIRGVLMPGTIAMGDRYYEERAPMIAMGRVENVSTNETVQTPAGEFQHCLKTKKTSELEAGTKLKWYAPDIGLVQESKLKLVRRGFVKK